MKGSRGRRPRVSSGVPWVACAAILAVVALGALAPLPEPGVAVAGHRQARPWPAIGDIRAYVGRYWKVVGPGGRRGRSCPTAGGFAECVYQVGRRRPDPCELDGLEGTGDCTNPRWKATPALMVTYAVKTRRAVEVEGAGYRRDWSRYWWAALQHFVPPAAHRVSCRRIGDTGRGPYYHACLYRWRKQDILVFRIVGATHPRYEFAILGWNYKGLTPSCKKACY